MKKQIILLFLSITIVFAQGRKYLPGRVIIKPKEQGYSILKNSSVQQALAKGSALQKSIDPISSLYNLKEIKNIKAAEKIGLNRIQVLKVDKTTDIEQLCKELANSPEIEWAEPDYIESANERPNDTYFNNLYYMRLIKAEEAWDIEKGSKTVPIAIIDTGVDWTHPDLADNIWINPGEDIDGDGIITAADSNNVDDDGNGYVDDFVGWDFVANAGDNVYEAEDGDTEDNNPMDMRGHGTHCAGLASAVTNNDLGVAGIGWNCSIMCLRIGWLDVDENGDFNGHGASSYMSKAFIYAADNGAKVASLSFSNGNSVLDGARYAYENGVAILTSAGNDDSDNLDDVSPLSKQHWAFNVAAVDDFDRKASYSNFGKYIDISAPGGDGAGLLSTVPNNFLYNSYYDSKRGTSMATPVAAGVVGLVRSHFPDWSVDKVYQQILRTCDSIEKKNIAYKYDLGAGRVNAFRALTEIYPELRLVHVEFHETNGDGNNIFETGEEVEMTFHVQNSWSGLDDVSVQLISENNMITPLNANITLDSLYARTEYVGVNDMLPITSNDENPLSFQISTMEMLPNQKISLVFSKDEWFDTLAVNIPVNSRMLVVNDKSLILSNAEKNALNQKNENKEISQYLEKIGVGYEETLMSSLVDSNYISNFQTVVWECDGNFTTLDKHDRDILGYFMDNGGKLLLSGHNIAIDLCHTSPFMKTQYKASSGESKIWFEQYFSCEYILHTIGENPIVATEYGMFNFDTFEYPEIVKLDKYSPAQVIPVNEAVSWLNYSGGNSAAVATSNAVFLSCGALSFIEDSLVVEELLVKSLNHIGGIKGEVTKFADTEFTGPYTVFANFQENIVISNLYYQYNNSSWQKIEMTKSDENKYTGELPKVNSNIAKIEYFLHAISENDNYFYFPRTVFEVSPDTIPPAGKWVKLQPETTNPLGPYEFEIAFSDKYGIDTNNVVFSYRINDTALEQLPMSFVDSTWKCSMIPENKLNFGDTVSYFITAVDLSNNANSVQIPLDGYGKFNISSDIILEDFETDLSNWTMEDETWQLFKNSIVEEGSRCLVSGNGKNYDQNLNSTATFNRMFNFGNNEKIVASFLAAHKFQDNNDTVFFEVKQGSGSWDILQSFYGKTMKMWPDYNININLSRYCLSHEPVQLRFRFKTDENSGLGIGFLVDKLQIFADEKVVGVDENHENLPTQFKLVATYPNPFNAQTNIKYSIPKAGVIHLDVYNLLGHIIYSEKVTHSSAGLYKFQWYGKDMHNNHVSSGMYFLKIMYDNQFANTKIVLLK